jgi:hypothetical protein
MYQDASPCFSERAAALGVGLRRPERVHRAAWSRQGPEMDV